MDCFPEIILQRGSLMTSSFARNAVLFTLFTALAAGPAAAQMEGNSPFPDVKLAPPSKIVSPEQVKKDLAEACSHIAEKAHSNRGVAFVMKGFPKIKQYNPDTPDSPATAFRTICGTIMPDFNKMIDEASVPDFKDPSEFLAAVGESCHDMQENMHGDIPGLFTIIDERMTRPQQDSLATLCFWGKPVDQQNAPELKKQ